MPISVGGGVGRHASSTLRRPLVVALALVVLVGAIAGIVWIIQFAPNLAFDGPSCSSSVPDPRRGGCVASLPIQDIAMPISATVGLSPNGDTLLLAGLVHTDKTTVMLAGFNVADRRETWRAPLDVGGTQV